MAVGFWVRFELRFAGCPYVHRDVSDDDHPFYVSTRCDLPLVADLITSIPGTDRRVGLIPPPYIL